MTRGKAIRLAIAAAMVVMIAFFVRKLDWHAIAVSTADASVPLLILATLGNVPLIWCKARRMKLLAGGGIATSELMGMYVASYAADNLFMSQAGLGVRVAMLARKGLPVPTAITTQVVEKVIEGVGLAIVALPLLGWDDLSPALRSTLEICLIFGAVGAALLVGLALVRSNKQGVVRKVAEVAAVLREPSLAARVGGYTMLAWASEYLIIWLTMAGMHVPMPTPLVPLVVLVAVNLAALIPGLPGNIGPFEMACVLALGTTSIAQEPALGFAIIYHALHTVPVTIVGFLPALRPDASRST
jgi:uncharacterized membrane protein YbhN (UPF0104 family)